MSPLPEILSKQAAIFSGSQGAGNMIRQSMYPQTITAPRDTFWYPSYPRQMPYPTPTPPYSTPSFTTPMTK